MTKPKDVVLAAVNPVRRRVPTPLVRAIVRTRSRLDTRSATRVARARSEMEHLVGAVLPADEVDALAAKYLAFDRRRGEHRWHPDLVSDQRVTGLEHLEAARAGGRGVLVTFVHHAHFDGSFLALKKAGAGALDAIAHPLMTAGEGGNFMRQHTYLCSLGATLHSAEIGSAGIGALLEQGRVVCIAPDVAGSTTVRFLNRERRGSSGFARLAQRTGSPIVVMTYGWDDQRDDHVAIHLHEPLNPADFAEPDDLLRAVLERHEPAVLAFPEAYDQPMKRWADVSG